MSDIAPRHVKSLIDLAADDAEHAASQQILMQHRRAYAGQVRRSLMEEKISRDTALDYVMHLPDRVRAAVVAYRYIHARRVFGRFLALDVLGYADDLQMEAAHDLVSTTSAALHAELFPRNEKVVIESTTQAEKEPS